MCFAELSSIAIRGSGHGGGCVLTMEAEESDVAMVAAVGPHQEERIENALDKAPASRTSHHRALALRALIHPFGK